MNGHGGKRPGSGRPKATVRETRSEIFRVRCTSDEKTTLQEIWSQLKLKSEFIEGNRVEILRGIHKGFCATIKLVRDDTIYLDLEGFSGPYLGFRSEDLKPSR